MRVFFLLLCLFVCMLFFWYFVIPKPNSAPSQPKADIPFPTATLNKPRGAIAWHGESYLYNFFTVSSDSKVTLIPNFTKKLTSTKIIKDEACAAGINAGFYTRENRPIGLFKTGKLSYPVTNNELFIGFISLTSNKISIGRNEPTNTTWAFQSGPLLLEDGQTLTLSLEHDEPARRMVLATAGQQTYAITIYGEDNEDTGPHLEDLANIVSEISKKEQLGLQAAVNLDGGHHSTFFSEGVHIQESQPVGSLLCVKK